MADRETILIVDDQPENIDIMIEALQASYDLMAATDGVSALERAMGDSRPDLILLDVMMPDMDGHEVCRRLKADPLTNDIPVIFVTALDDPDQEALGLGLGAVDYITKPISPPVVAARVRAHLQLTQARRILLHQNDVLEQRVKHRTAEVVRVQEERIEGLNNFANAMAHQIRNPVMALGGMAGLLLKKVPENSPLIGYAQAVRENSVRLENLVSIISEYVSLTINELAPASVRELVDIALERARDTAESMGKRVRRSTTVPDAMILVDAKLVVLALVEIMRNSVEFCEGDSVELTITGGRESFEGMSATEDFYVQGSRYWLRITDNGPGIPKKRLPFVSDPFFTSKASGVGLGLTRAKRILHDELGGAFFVESTPGQGVSVFMDFLLDG